MARGVTSESHHLYGTFLTRLSRCIFEWDEKDFRFLISAKRAELVKTGIQNPSLSTTKKAITREELARHCHRRTWGAEKTAELIEALLLALTSARDTLGVPLLKEEMKQIWEEQKSHISCIQDPPNVQLYTNIGHLEKGGVRLPYQCLDVLVGLHRLKVFTCT